MPNLNRRPDRALIENLEIRRHLSTVNILDFGARPNDGVDDAAAIRKAISASRPGDTILFSGGVFNLSNEILLTNDRTYLGQNGGALKGVGSYGHLLAIKGDNVTVRGLTIEGGGIFMDKSGGRNTNIVLDSNVFKLNNTGLHRSAVTFTSGLSRSKITNNYFTGYNGSFGIYGYNYNDLTIANNEFVNIGAGMHIAAFGNSGNLLVEQNYIQGTRGMGLEFQGTANNLVFQDNWYERPAFTTIPGSANGDTMAYSLIIDGSTNVTIQRNVMIAPPKGSTKDYVRINFEVGGDNTLVTENYSDGGNHVVAVNDGNGSASVRVVNNQFKNFAQGVSISFPSADRTLTQSNNGSNVDLSWDINRGKPGRHKRLGLNGVVSENDVPEGNESEPTPSKPRYNVDDFKYLSDIDWESANSSWGPVEKDMSNGKNGKGDGWMLRLGSKSYTKGLGVAADSAITYKLDGKYSMFFADIGVDEYAESAGTMTFEVWVDGKLAYDSGLMTGETFRKGITIDVEGAKRLKLVTTDGGDGHKSDHGNWAAARLLPKG